MKWFRMYNEFANDAKVQTLSETIQRRYVMLLCFQSADELQKMTEKEIAFALRISPKKWSETARILEQKGLIFLAAGGNEKKPAEIKSYWKINNWDKRQMKSDDVTSRVRRYRDSSSQCNVTETLQKRYRNVLDTDTDTDTYTPPKSPSGRGTFSKPKRPKKYAHEIQPAAPEKIPPDSKKKRLADLEESGILNLDPPSVKDMFRLRDEVTPDPSPNQMAAECDELEQLLKDNQMDDLKEKIIQSRIEVLSRRMENVS